MSKKPIYSDFPDTISFPITGGTVISSPKQPRSFSPSNVAADIEKIAKFGLESYNSLAQKGGIWKITVIASAPGMRSVSSFTLQKPSDHKKIDQFFASLNAGYDFVSASASGNVITLTRKRRGPKPKKGPLPPPRTFNHAAGQTYRLGDAQRFRAAYLSWPKGGKKKK